MDSDPAAPPRLILGPEGAIALATDVAIRRVPIDDTRIGCVADGVDGQRLSRVAPGQLISMFGARLRKGSGLEAIVFRWNWAACVSSSTALMPRYFTHRRVK